MAVFGIVSEFNPFHSGHKYLIDSAKALGADAVVCVMSGNSTQRGELALIDKYLRAEAACEGGADLVLELPFPFCSSSAESFALGGIHILSSFCDTVIFGSECGDISLIGSAASLTSSDEFKAEYSSALANGERSAESYISIIKKHTDVALSSNDLLGVEYVKAARTLPYADALSFVTLNRKGSGYRECELGKNGEPDSAMAIRKAFFDGKLDTLDGKLPKRSFELLSKAYGDQSYVDTEKLLDTSRLYFRLCEPEYISRFAECDGGIAERICRCAHESRSGEEFFESLRTKRYTDAKLRRAILFALCAVKKEDLAHSSLPVYTNLLAASEKGRELLSKSRKTESITVITKPADALKIQSKVAQKQSELAAKLDAVYSFSLSSSEKSGSYLLKRPYIS